MANPEHFSSKLNKENAIEYTLGLKSKGKLSNKSDTLTETLNSPSLINPTFSNELSNPENNYNFYNQSIPGGNFNPNWFETYNINHYESLNDNEYYKDEPAMEAENFVNNKKPKNNKKFSKKIANTSSMKKNDEPVKPPIKKSKCASAIIAVIVIFVLLVIGACVAFALLYLGFFNKMPSYLESCSTSNPCVTNGDLICNGTCVCTTYKYWNGTMCSNYSTFGGACKINSNCVNGLTCINNLCQCQNTSYYANGQCDNKLSYSSTCSQCSYSSCSKCDPCNQCQDYSYGYCNSTISKCMCTNDAYYDTNAKLCVKPASYNEVCYSNIQCTSKSTSLACINGVCVCSAMSYYWSTHLQNCDFCPSDWTIISYGNSQTCIKDYSTSVGAVNKTYVDVFCGTTYQAHILRLNDSNLFTKIKSLILRTDYVYWLHASDDTTEGKFMWTNYIIKPSQSIDSSIIPWCNLQPDGGTSQNCLVLAAVNWCLADIECSNNNVYFFCQMLY